MGVYSLDKLIEETRRLATEYRKTTGKTLGGVSAEIAQHDAARLLDLEVCPEPHPGGYDAIGRGRRAGRRIQIKGRAIFDGSGSGARIGQLKLDQEWDSVVLVLMDETFSPIEIYEADREEIEAAMQEAGASRRTRRGAMSVGRFRHVGHLVWNAAEGLVEDEIWEHPGQ